MNYEVNKSFVLMQTTTCKAQDLGMLYFCADIFFSFREWCVNSFELCCLVNSYVWYIVQGMLDEEGLHV